MSLDVYLTIKGVQNLPSGPVIFIREDGQTKQVTQSEWNERFPECEPVTVELPENDETVYRANITHNLNTMAKAAGIYECLWRPDETNISKAKQLIEPLQMGLNQLKNDRATFKKFNPANNWGTYELLVEFVENYLKACKQYPESEVRVSR